MNHNATMHRSTAIANFVSLSQIVIRISGVKFKTRKSQIERADISRVLKCHKCHTLQNELMFLQPEFLDAATSS
jgi:hypothetical protein